MRTGYEIREGSRILAARFAEVERLERERQLKIRAGFAHYLDRRLAKKRAA